MVEQQIRARGVRDERVLQVMECIPRERFVLPDDLPLAFDDRALAIDAGQTISQPFMVASMTEHLDLRPTHRVLEVGTGSGYQTAVLAELAAEVCTIERHPFLLDQARRRLETLGVRNVRYRLGDGSLGWPEVAPFDRILVTAGSPGVPPPLVEQLADAGRLVLPVGPTDTQMLTLIERRGPRTIETPLYPCRFVKLIGRAGWLEARLSDSPDAP